MCHQILTTTVKTKHGNRLGELIFSALSWRTNENIKPVSVNALIFEYQI